MAFEYDAASRRYRDSASGRYVSSATISRFRDTMLDRSVARVDDLTKQLSDGSLSLTDWRTAMRAEIKQLHINEYLLGRGGVNRMTQSDWGRIGAECRKQYAYLDRFIGEIELGTLSEAQIAARARMYTAGGNMSFARGQERAWSIQLPAHPGDGSTPCLGWCRCHWSIRETVDGIAATWILGDAQHCEECAERADTWAPLWFDKQTGTQMEAAA